LSNKDKSLLLLFGHVARLADDVPAWCPAMFRLEACPRPTSYHLDSADLQRWEATAKRFACRKEGLTYWLFLNTRDERKLH